MIEELKKSNKNENLINFFDNGFKFLVVAFWIMCWYKGMVPINRSIQVNIFILYTLFSILYLITYILLFKLFNIKTEPIKIKYRISTILAYIFSSCSFFIFPNNALIFAVQILFLLTYLYFSISKVYKYKMEEGVVGILSALLMLTVTIFYR